MSIDRTSALKPVSAVQPRETNDAPAQKTRLEKPSTSNSTSVTLSDAQQTDAARQQRYQYGTC